MSGNGLLWKGNVGVWLTITEELPRGTFSYFITFTICKMGIIRFMALPGMVAHV